MFIADMLSRAYPQTDHTLYENDPEFQIFQLKEEEKLFNQGHNQKIIMNWAMSMVKLSS